jgi:predicted aspartyl protease
MRRGFPALLLLLAGTATQAESPPPVCHYHQAAVLPVSFDNLQITTQATINGTSVRMLVDSGSESTFLTYGEAQTLGLRLGDSRLRSYGVSGESLTSVTDIDDISIGAAHGKDVELLVIDDTASPMRVGGVIGVDFLFRSDVELSPAEQKIKFFVAQDCATPFLARWEGSISRVEMRHGPGSDTRPRITVELNGQPVTALIDTGAQNTVIDLRAGRKAGLAPDSPGVEAQTSTVGGIGTHALSQWIVPLSTVTIGDETIKNVKLHMADLWGAARRDRDTQAMFEMGVTQPMMLLGADFLRSHHVLFARSQGQLYFSYLGGKVFQTSGK